MNGHRIPRVLFSISLSREVGQRFLSAPCRRVIQYVPNLTRHFIFKFIDEMPPLLLLQSPQL